MYQCCLIYFYIFNSYICTKSYHGMCKYQQVNFFSNAIKNVRPTYGNKEELAPLIKINKNLQSYIFRALFKINEINNAVPTTLTDPIFARITDIKEYYDAQDFHGNYARSSFLFHKCSLIPPPPVLFADSFFPTTNKDA